MVSEDECTHTSTSCSRWINHRSDGDYELMSLSHHTDWEQTLCCYSIGIFFFFFLVRFFFLPFLLVSGSTVPSVDLLLINHQLWFHHCYYLRQHNSSFIVFTQLVRYCRTSGEGTDVLQLMWWEAYQIKSVRHWEEHNHAHTHTHVCVLLSARSGLPQKTVFTFALA